MYILLFNIINIVKFKSFNWLKYVPFVDVLYCSLGGIPVQMSQQTPLTEKNPPHRIDTSLITKKRVHCEQVFAFIKDIFYEKTFTMINAYLIELP